MRYCHMVTWAYDGIHIWYLWRGIVNVCAGVYTLLEKIKTRSLEHPWFREVLLADPSVPVRFVALSIAQYWSEFF